MQEDIDEKVEKIYEDTMGRWYIIVERMQGPSRNFYNLKIQDCGASGTKKFFGRDHKAEIIGMSKRDLSFDDRVSYDKNLVRIRMPRREVVFNYQI